MIDKKKQGKKNRQSGARFELKVRKDLESKGWVVSKWMNNLEVIPDVDIISPVKAGMLGKTREEMAKQRGYETFKLIPAKHRFRGPGIPMAIGTGFPDFIAYDSPDKDFWEMDIRMKELGIEKFSKGRLYHVIGVEVKSNGYLDKEEKAKCKWLLDNNIFSKILIASKGKKRGEIIYKEFENGNHQNNKS